MKQLGTLASSAVNGHGAPQKRSLQSGAGVEAKADRGHLLPRLGNLLLSAAGVRKKRKNLRPEMRAREAETERVLRMQRRAGRAAAATATEGAKAIQASSCCFGSRLTFDLPAHRQRQRRVRSLPLLRPDEAVARLGEEGDGLVALWDRAGARVAAEADSERGVETTVVGVRLDACVGADVAADRDHRWPRRRNLLLSDIGARKR